MTFEWLGEESAPVGVCLARQERCDFVRETWRRLPEVAEPRVALLVREIEDPVEQWLQRAPAVVIHDATIRRVGFRG